MHVSGLATQLLRNASCADAWKISGAIMSRKGGRGGGGGIAWYLVIERIQGPLTRGRKRDVAHISLVAATLSG